MTRVQVRVANDVSAVPARQWDELVARPPASVNCSRTWVAAALATVDRDRTPHLLGAYRGERLVAMLPLTVDRSTSTPTARFAAWPHNDLGDLVVLPGNEDAATAILDELRAMAARGWVVELDEVDPAGVLAAADRDRGVLEWARADYAPVIDLRGPWRSAASRRRRAQWDRALRRLRARHVVELRRVEGDGVGAALPDFVRLRALRAHDDPHPLEMPPLALLDAAVPPLARDGRCACVELRLDGRVVAADLYLLDPPVGLMWLRAMDPAGRPFSCGHLLLRDTAESLAAEGYAALDLGVGDEPYKFVFGAEPRVLLRASIGRSR